MDQEGQALLAATRMEAGMERILLQSLREEPTLQTRDVRRLGSRENKCLFQVRVRGDLSSSHGELIHTCVAPGEPPLPSTLHPQSPALCPM